MSYVFLDVVIFLVLRFSFNHFLYGWVSDRYCLNLDLSWNILLFPSMWWTLPGSPQNIPSAQRKLCTLTQHVWFRYGGQCLGQRQPFPKKLQWLGLSIHYASGAVCICPPPFFAPWLWIHCNEVFQTSLPWKTNLELKLKQTLCSLSCFCQGIFITTGKQTRTTSLLGILLYKNYSLVKPLDIERSQLGRCVSPLHSLAGIWHGPGADHWPHLQRQSITLGIHT